MNFFAQIVTAFSVAAVFIGALYMICPDGAISKSVRYVLGLAFILTLITAAGITVKRTDIDFNFTSVTETDTSQTLISAARYVYSYTLTKQGINFKEITVCTNKAQDGSIIINKIVINSDCEKEKIIKALSQVAQNYEVEIINE